MGFKAQSGIAQQDQQGPLIANVGGINYEVYDGDTLYQLDEENNRTSGGLRVQGIQARETRKETKDGVIFDEGELGGDESKFILYDYLNKKGDSLDRVDLGEQTLGRGAGQRGLIDFVDKNTGSGLSTSFAEADISPVTSWESKEDYEARKLGRLSRGIIDGSKGDGLDDLRELSSGHTQQKGSGVGVFKGLALNEAWYDPKYSSGVQWRHKDRTLWNEDKQRGGFAKNPLDVAWDSGWTNAEADAGAFLNSFGVVLGSDWLKDKGNAITLRQNQITSEYPELAVQSLSDIGADNYWDTVKNSVEWLGVNSAMSIPYMAAIGASAVGASALAPVVGATAGTALAILPAFSLHAGSTWNDLDQDKKTRGSAGKVYTAALAMTMLDRLSLGHVLKSPGQLLTKEGQDLAIAAIAAREGITEGAAKIIFNKTARDETVKFLEHHAKDAAKFIEEGKILKDTLAGFANAAPTEAVTEAMQELISYFTAAEINGETPTMSEALNIAANSAAAGFFIGGIAGGAGSSIGAVRNDRVRKDYLEDYDPTTQNEYVQHLEKFESDVGHEAASIEGSINNLKAIRKTQDADRPDITERDDGLWASLARAGKDQGIIKDLFVKPTAGRTGDDLQLDGVLRTDRTEFKVPGVGDALGAVGKLAGKLTRASTRVEIRPEDLANNAYLQIFKRLDFHGTSGRNLEGRRDAMSGLFDAVVGESKILSSLGYASNATDARKFTKELIALGESKFLDKIAAAGWQFDKLSQADQDLYLDPSKGHTKDRLQRIAYGAMRMSNSSNAQIDAELKALELEHGANSDIVKAFKAEMNTDRSKQRYWKDVAPSREKVAKDPEGYIKLLAAQKKDIMENAQTLNLSKRDLADLKRINPEAAVNAIIDGASVSGESFSLVGGQKWSGGKSLQQLLDLQNTADYSDKWGETNVFTALSKRGSDTAKRVSHLEFFGDGGKDLDFLIRQAIDLDIANGMSSTEAKRKAQRVAESYTNIIDSASHNYNRIKNPKVAKMQRFLLSYTGIVGLGLSGPASIPEFLTIALDLMSFKEARVALFTASAQIRDTIKKSLNNEFLTVADRAGITVDQEKRVDNAMFDTLQQIGVPSSVTDVYNKWGAEGGEPISENWQAFQSGFFKYVTGIHGITQIQRQMNAAFGTDFARERLVVLMGAEFDKKLTRKQGEAYAQLKGLGMDVRKVLNILKGHGDVDFATRKLDRQTLAYNTDTVSDVQMQAIKNGISVVEQYARNANNKNFDREADASALNEQMGLFLQNFVNQRIQNPGAANRSLIVQDPRFQLVTQFNGFISTITTTIVPKLWNDKIGQAIRKKDPTLSYDAFATIVALVIMGGVGQWLRDWLKYRDEAIDPFNSPHLETSEVIQRAFMSAGIFGQFEKPINWFMPRSYQQDEPFGVRVGSEFGGPILQHVENFISGTGHLAPSIVHTSEGGTYTKPADYGAALNDFLKSVPGTAVLPTERHSIVEALTDKQYK